VWGDAGAGRLLSYDVEWWDELLGTILVAIMDAFPPVVLDRKTGNAVVTAFGGRLALTLPEAAAS